MIRAPATVENLRGSERKAMQIGMETLDLEVEIEIVPWTLVWETTDRMVASEPKVIVDEELMMDVWCSDWARYSADDPLATIALGDLDEPLVFDDRRTVGRLVMGGAATALLSAIVMLLI